MSYPSFESIKRYYEKHAYTIEDIKFYTKYGALTKEEYKEITGEDYPEQPQV
ncbi:XkdX family protein [Staphylococcus equorum]|uniref:XkdX family protein n=1 Tax=Staphylococcus equorum TaxID=246432 RepID=A0A9X4LGH5_9STAP|nr:XkdX family protein [Staphylococcus equorum]MDG0860335.1 XkdX family protein [Staphylococcus equorum]